MAILVLAGGLALACGGAEEMAPDAANATYTIEGLSVTLLNGSAEREAAPGSASKVVTKLGDKQAQGDLNGDGKPDAAVSLIQSPGGSGTFYYVAVLVNDGKGHSKATAATLLGDRLAVTKLEIVGRQVVVEYLTRRAGEPLTTQASVPAAKRFALKRGGLEEVGP